MHTKKSNNGGGKHNTNGEGSRNHDKNSSHRVAKNSTTDARPRNGNNNSGYRPDALIPKGPRANRGAPNGFGQQFKTQSVHPQDHQKSSSGQGHSQRDGHRNPRGHGGRDGYNNQSGHHTSLVRAVQQGHSGNETNSVNGFGQPKAQFGDGIMNGLSTFQDGHHNTIQRQSYAPYQSVPTGIPIPPQIMDGGQETAEAEVAEERGPGVHVGYQKHDMPVPRPKMPLHNRRLLAKMQAFTSQALHTGNIALAWRCFEGTTLFCEPFWTMILDKMEAQAVHPVVPIPAIFRNYHVAFYRKEFPGKEIGNQEWHYHENLVLKWNCALWTAGGNVQAVVRGCREHMKSIPIDEDPMDEDDWVTQANIDLNNAHEREVLQKFEVEESRGSPKLCSYWPYCENDFNCKFWHPKDGPENQTPRLICYNFMFEPTGCAAGQNCNREHPVDNQLNNNGAYHSSFSLPIDYRHYVHDETLEIIRVDSSDNKWGYDWQIVDKRLAELHCLFRSPCYDQQSFRKNLSVCEAHFVNFDLAPDLEIQARPTACRQANLSTQLPEDHDLMRDMPSLSESEEKRFAATLAVVRDGLKQEAIYNDEKLYAAWQEYEQYRDQSRDHERCPTQCCMYDHSKIQENGSLLMLSPDPRLDTTRYATAPREFETIEPTTTSQAHNPIDFANFRALLPAIDLPDNSNGLRRAFARRTLNEGFDAYLELNDPNVRDVKAVWAKHFPKGCFDPPAPSPAETVVASADEEKKRLAGERARAKMAALRASMSKEAKDKASLPALQTISTKVSTFEVAATTKKRTRGEDTDDDSTSQKKSRLDTDKAIVESEVSKMEAVTQVPPCTSAPKRKRGDDGVLHDLSATKGQCIGSSQKTTVEQLVGISAPAVEPVVQDARPCKKRKREDDAGEAEVAEAAHKKQRSRSESSTKEEEKPMESASSSRETSPTHEVFSRSVSPASTATDPSSPLPGSPDPAQTKPSGDADVPVPEESGLSKDDEGNDEASKAKESSRVSQATQPRKSTSQNEPDRESDRHDDDQKNDQQEDDANTPPNDTPTNETSDPAEQSLDGIILDLYADEMTLEEVRDTLRAIQKATEPHTEQRKEMMTSLRQEMSDRGISLSEPAELRLKFLTHYKITSDTAMERAGGRPGLVLT